MAQTPAMEQHRKFKEKYPDCVLLFRMGDFYEMFGEDAIFASSALELALTSRGKGETPEDKIPMCGFPYHSAEPYIARLVARNRKVAVCEQVEDPAKAKGLVRRDVIRVVTPGTVTESSMLEEGRNNYLCALYRDSEGWSACFADVSTGQLYGLDGAGDESLERLRGELGRYTPREAILSDGAASHKELVAFLTDKLGCLVQTYAERAFYPPLCAGRVQSALGDKAVEALQEHPTALRAVGGLLAYLDENKLTVGAALALHMVRPGVFMELDLHTRRHLELTQPMWGEGLQGSLLGVLQHTVTPMGTRELRRMVETPLTEPVEIDRRLSAVEALHRDTPLRNELRRALRGAGDAHRILSRLTYGTGGARELRQMTGILSRLPELKTLLGGVRPRLLQHIADDLTPLPALQDELDRALVAEPPHSIREGGFIAEGYHAEVDRLRAIVKDTRGLVAAMEAQEREKTGLKTLKVGYNRVFGYYIEVSRLQSASMPSHYVRRQTLANSERFVTEELHEMERTILTAQDRLTALEGELFEALRQQTLGAAAEVRRSADAMARLDALASLAEAAARHRYARPQVDDSGKIEIRDGRHPVVEQMLRDSLFVPNDTDMDLGRPVSILTGPNMAGKSTYMRQVALIVLMAQIGSFVPAASARIGAVDRIFTRIGASDDLSGGRSTFMVEMSEVADILREATGKSLLLLDEIGRGTSTFDGMSVARAVLEYVADRRRLGARTLFATHYHELTVLEEENPAVVNYNVAVKKRGSDIVFLRKIVRGGADDSYGVEVAALAGLPDSVIRRAREVLRALEAGDRPAEAKARPAHKEAPAEQVTLGDLSADTVAARLRALDVNTLTPLEALNLVYQLKKELEG